MVVRAALWRGGGCRAVRRKTITKRERKKHAKEAGRRGETGGVEEKKGAERGQSMACFLRRFVC